MVEGHITIHIDHVILLCDINDTFNCIKTTLYNEVLICQSGILIFINRVTIMTLSVLIYSVNIFNHGLGSQE